jgi:hypothetical protein
MRNRDRLVLLSIGVGLAMLWNPLAWAAPANYNIRLSGIDIFKTRSLHKDTVYAQFTLLVNDRVIRTVQWDGSCNNGSCQTGRDMNDGLHNFGLALSADTGQISDADRVTWQFQIINSGHPPSAQNYTAAAGALARATCQGDPDGSAESSFYTCAAGDLFRELTGLFTANCDGPLAADKVTMTGAQLWAATQTRQNRGMFSAVVQKTYKGIDSPSGCGGNSNYQVDVWIDRR